MTDQLAIRGPYHKHDKDCPNCESPNTCNYFNPNYKIELGTYNEYKDGLNSCGRVDESNDALYDGTMRYHRESAILAKEMQALRDDCRVEGILIDENERLKRQEDYMNKEFTEFKSGGQKEIEGKLRMDLIPPEVTKAYAEVLTFGAQKYEDRNWEKGIPFSQCLAALKRHLLQFELGEMINEESGLLHVQHAAFWANALVTYLARNRKDLNDLPNYGDIK